MTQWWFSTFAMLALFVPLVVRGEIRIDDDWKQTAEFLELHGGYVHPALQMADIYGGRGIVAKDHIPEGTRLLRVPFELFISRNHVNGSVHGVALGPGNQVSPVVAAIENSGVYEDWETQPDSLKTGPDVSVVVWMALERLKRYGPFTPYFRALRADLIGHSCEIDSQASANLTEDELMSRLEKQLPKMGPYFSAEVLEHYKYILNYVDPALIHGLTLMRYMQAFYSLFTRSFSIQGVRTIVPVLCFVNHDLHPTASHTLDEDVDNAIDLWASRDLEPGEQITITYNHHGNRMIYDTYGFTLPMLDDDDISEWYWHDKLNEAYSVDYSELQPFTGEWNSLQELSSYGVAPLDVMNRVLQPKLKEIEERVHRGFDVDYVENSCDVHKHRIERSADFAVLKWKPVMHASKRLEALFGADFVDAVLSSDGHVTALFVESANKRFNLSSSAGKCSLNGECGDALRATSQNQLPTVDLDALSDSV